MKGGKFINKLFGCFIHKTPEEWTGRINLRNGSMIKSIHGKYFQNDVCPKCLCEPSFCPVAHSSIRKSETLFLEGMCYKCGLCASLENLKKVIWCDRGLTYNITDETLNIIKLFKEEAGAKLI